MKKKFGLILFSTLALSLSSCGFQDFFTVKLKSVKITDERRNYVIGQSYFDYADLSIKGTYSDNTSKVFEIEDATFSLTLDGTSYDINSPFTVAGNYSLRATVEGVRSNALTIKVLAENIYVSDISISGNNELKVNQEIDLTVSVSPVDYTTDLICESADTSIATVRKIKDNKYRVKGVSLGNTQIIFKSLKNKTEYLTSTHSISVTPTYVNSISIVGPTSVAIYSSINLSLNVNPTDFSVDINATSSDTDIATVSKINNKSFKVEGLDVGEVDITFKALKNASEYVTATTHITVTNLQKTVISQTYNTFTKHSYYTLSSCPLEGSAKLLVIPVWFTNSTSYISESKKANVRSDIQTAYFGSKEDTGWHSVATYYNEESSNELSLSGTVSEWWECGLSSYDVGDEDYDTSSLVLTAVNWYFNNHSDNRRNYDSDGDGYIDAVMLIYGAPDNSADSSQGENMWAYCYWIQKSTQKNTTSPGSNVFFWASYDFMYGSNKAYSRTGSNFHSGDTTYSNIDTHTFIHEMGHVFGLEDYYDYAGSTNPAAGFSMQDYNVGGHDPFSVMSFGWADPYIPTTSSEITINDFQSSRDLILLTPSWNGYNSPFDEYLLLELYSPTGLNEFDSIHHYSGSYPQGPSVPGIRVWHVDARLLNAYNSNFTTNANASKVVGAFNNTSDSQERECNAGAEYQKYNILQLIRNSTFETASSNSILASNHLFRQGSSFSMSNFYRQFPDGNKLNNGSSLGWSFVVNSITNSSGIYSATITVTKA